jgi:hypothetical protein
MASNTSDMTVADLAAFGVRVGSLETDVGEINTRLSGLENKFDAAIGAMALEFRTSLTALTTQLSERNKTPWGVIFAGAAVVATVIGMIGSQALSPMQTDIAILKRDSIPRVEHDYEKEVIESRFAHLEHQIQLTEEHRYDEMVETIKTLRSEREAVKKEQLRDERDDLLKAK